MDFKQYLAELKNKSIPKEMAFTDAEFRGRVQKVRGFMAESGLDALLVTEVPNVCYLSGFETFVPNNFACMILPGAGDPTLQVAEFEIPGALLNSWVEDVRATRFNDPEATAKEFAEILGQHKLDGKRIGLETRLNGFTIELYEKLKAALPGANFVDASDLVFRARLIKSSAELVYMRKAADIVRPALDETLNSVRTGMTENDIAAVAYAALARGGSEFFSCQPCVMAAHRAGWIHTSQRGMRLKAGQTAMMEMGAFCHRYVSAVMHTVVIGEPSPAVTRLTKAAHNTLDLVRQAVRPGRSAHEAAREIRKGLDPVQHEAYSTGMFGYAVGLSFPPTWREGRFMIAEGVEQTFSPGMAFLTPVTLRHPGVLGVGFTDTFVVTETGCEALTARDRSLTVVKA
jgi:Xaa-Pro aminopeptidase